MTISEITGLDGTTILTQDIFTFVYDEEGGVLPTGKLLPTGIVPQCIGVLRDRGVEVNSEIFRK